MMYKKYDFTEVTIDEYLVYRHGEKDKALWQVDGVWVTSSRTNAEVYNKYRFQKKAIWSRQERNSGALPRIMKKGKTNILSYLEAIEAQKEEEDGSINITNIARKYGCFVSDLRRIFGLLKEKGEEGFFRYE